MLANNDDYLNALGRIKKEIAEAQNRAVQSANAEVIRLYWRVGSVLNDNSRYGKVFIESLAKDIRLAFPKIKGFSARSMCTCGSSPLRWIPNSATAVAEFPGAI